MVGAMIVVCRLACGRLRLVASVVADVVSVVVVETMMWALPPHTPVLMSASSGRWERRSPLLANVANRCSHRRINGAGYTASHTSDFAFVEAVVVVYADRRAMRNGLKVDCSAARSAFNY